MRHYWLSTCVLSISLLFANRDAHGQLLDDVAVRTNNVRIVKVTGVAKAEVMPDLAVATIRIQSRSQTSVEALATNSKEMAIVLDALYAKGIAKNDISTAGISLSPVRESLPGDNERSRTEIERRKIIAYEVSHNLSVKVREIKRLGEILDNAVKAGAGHIDGVEFEITRTEEIMRDLRKRALADAKAQAREAADEAGMRLGFPVSIRYVSELDLGLAEVLGPKQYAFQARSIRSDGGTSIAVGEQTPGAIVSVSYEIMTK